MLVGGIHGDEPATVALLRRFSAEHLRECRMPVAIVALANPDGLAANSRYNRRRVDLNRNFPHRWTRQSVEPSGPAPLSEPETIALHRLTLRLRPSRIVSLHWALAEVEADGYRGNSLATRLWEAMSPGQRRPYRLRLYDPEHPPEDYCPGSLGQWCGHAPDFVPGHLPEMVTLELPYEPETRRPPDPLPPDHLSRVKERWRTDSEGYLRAVWPGVERMLCATCAVDG